MVIWIVANDTHSPQNKYNVHTVIKIEEKQGTPASHDRS